MRKSNQTPSLLPVALAFPCLLAVAACDKLEDYFADEPAEDEAVALYQTASVQQRDIIVAVEAAGIIEPVTTVEVKSKASGEILALPVDTGDHVEAGTMLARVDRRVLNNSLQMAKANLEVAKARLTNAESSLERVTQLYEQESLSKADFEQATLEHATAGSEVVRGEIQVENATIQLDDSDVISPITGTVIERLVEQGQVISSPMGDVGGGTLLMKMADLSHVQVRMLVDEIDIGKVQPGVGATVNVAAYPNRPFEGRSHEGGAASGGTAERHHVPGTDRHRESRRSSEARHERRSRSADRRAPRRAHHTQRCLAHARRHLRGRQRARPRPRRNGAAAGCGAATEWNGQCQSSARRRR